MAYEHEAEKDAVVNAVFDIIEKAADGVQVDELFPILGDVISAVQAAQAALDAEAKKIFKVKFAGKVGIGLANKGLDKFLPDEA